MTLNLPHTPLLFYASPVPACCVVVVAGVRVQVGAVVNLLGTVYPVIKLASILVGGCVQSCCSYVHCEAAALSSIACGVNTNTHLLFQAPIPGRLIN